MWFLSILPTAIRMEQWNQLGDPSFGYENLQGFKIIFRDSVEMQLFVVIRNRVRTSRAWQKLP